MKPKMQAALTALLSSKSVAEAAQVAKISETTLRAYLRNDEFLRAYRAGAAAQTEQATRRLQQSVSAAVDRLARIVADDDAPAAAQISASRTLLEYCLRFTEATDILARLDEVEKAVER